MEKNQECMYCMEDERRDNLMIEICELGVSTVFCSRSRRIREGAMWPTAIM